MEWPYEYTPHLWPMISSSVFLTVLGLYAVLHRYAPGAKPFVMLFGLGLLWVAANAFGLAATRESTRTFWFQFESVLLAPLAVSGLCFVLEYAGLGKYLTRRKIALLSLPPLVFAILIFTNESHRLVWTRIWFEGTVRADMGPAHWAGLAYGYLLSLLHLTVLAWLFARSPRHRWIAAGLILAPFAIRGASLLKFMNWNPVAPVDPVVIVLNFALLPYAWAIIGFRMFDVVPVGRHAMVEGMRDGMMVFDAQNRVADANETALKFLGAARPKMIGRQAAAVLNGYPDLLRFVCDPGEAQREISFEDGRHRCFQVSRSPLIDRRGYRQGLLVWFHDITEQRHAHAEILDHQRALAVLKERELLARELHDGIGQMLAAAHLQVKAGKELLARGEKVFAETCLRRTADLIQEAKDSIRAYLNGVKTGSGREGLLPPLSQYLKQFKEDFGLQTELYAPPEFDEKRIDSILRTQLEPIIHEALMNVKKHSGASSARVVLAHTDGELSLIIEDHGRGFIQGEEIQTQGFGLRSMRGRAESLGAQFLLNSAPGKGTQVVLRVPWKGRKYENSAGR